MQEATFLILTALAAGAQHGYGIIAEVQQISGDRVRLRAGTLYTALDRLRADGLIGVDREEVVEGRLRRYYRLTPEGTGRLAAETARLQANAHRRADTPEAAGGGHMTGPARGERGKRRVSPTGTRPPTACASKAARHESASASGPVLRNTR